MTQLRINGTGPTLDSKLGQFFTPQPLADRVAAWAVARWDRNTGSMPRCMEPSAGSGNLVAGLLSAGARGVAAYDIDHRWADAMTERFWNARNLSISCADFMATSLLPTFDLAVMNPPWDAGVYGLHIARAISACKRAVAVVPSAVLFGVNNHALLWGHYHLTGLVCFKRRPKFLGNGGQLDVVVVEISHKPGHQTIEWW